MAEGVVLSSDQGDSDDRLVTTGGTRIRDTQLMRSTDTLDWTVTSPSVLRRVVMTQDASNSISASVSGNWLRFTGAAAGGNQREAWLFPDSQALNSEIETVIGLPGSIGQGIAQWGNLHQVYRDSAGLWHAVACWTDTTLPFPPLINFAPVTFSGASTMNLNLKGQNSIGMALDAVRYTPVYRAQRTSNVVTIWTASKRLPPVGSTGNLVGNADTTFHITGGTVTAVDRGLGTFTYAQTAANATDASAGGTWQPATKWASLPLRLRSRLQGNILSAMVYQGEDAKPDWSDADRVTSYDLTGGTPTFVAAEGFSGLWVAHIESGNTIDFGQSSWRRLPG
jgi:hypothetical protein